MNLPAPLPLRDVLEEVLDELDELERHASCPPPSREQVLARMPYREYLLTPEWQERRRAALDRAGHRCQVCNKRSSLHVHHRTYERRGRELPGDLTVLCSGCHALFHGKIPAPRKGRS